MAIDDISEEEAPTDPEDLEEDSSEDLLDDDAVPADGDSDVDEDSTDDEESEGTEEALDELEAEELEMLTEDETSEALVVDEAAEMRAIRRAELAMDQQGVAEATEGEFVCTSCFLVLKTSQLANPRKKVCKDCAA
ncbi:MAG: DUF4193 family protein [Actinomycetota bacterium]